MKALTILAALILCIPAIGAEAESEHPPLPENTKRAIADYKQDPTDANKEKLLKVMNDNYDTIIQTKKDKLAERVRDREKNLNRWMQAIRSGDLPPFMKLNTENHKGNERKAIADAADAYRQNASPQNEDKVKQALNAYYDVFLAEQEQHIKDTEDSRATRMAAGLEHFTSDRFRPGRHSATTSIAQDDALAEIICSCIAIGAEIVPVNPEARVRERGFNSAINTAQASYLKNPTADNRAKLKEEIAKAFQATYDVRLEESVQAEDKGLKGARALFAQLQDEDARQRLFLDLTQQRNLYGRIDRTVTFGSNTVSDWEPRMKTESQELATLLKTCEQTPTEENKRAAEAKYNDIYVKMLDAHKAHLNGMKTKLDSFAAETLKELAN